MSAYPALRLVRDDEAALSPALADPLDAESLRKQIAELHYEMEAMRLELGLLRRRDETLNWSMQRIDEELRLAARLQQDFLPKSLPQLANVHFHTLFRPAGYVSGDLYDVSRLDERHVGFYMADAVGHGMPAALLTMFIKNAMVTKHIGPDGYRLLSPAESLTYLNEQLVEQNLSQATFATAFYGMINVETLEVQYARAGHPEPILMRKDGTLETLAADGGLLGIFEGEVYEARSVQMQPGDRLFVYTDGIEVAFCGEGAVDTEKWKDELYKFTSLSTDELLSEFANRLDSEVGSLTPKDDLTMIILEVR